MIIVQNVLTIDRRLRLEIKSKLVKAGSLVKVYTVVSHQS